MGPHRRAALKGRRTAQEVHAAFWNIVPGNGRHLTKTAPAKQALFF
jgi:hypothetical protein